MANFTAKRIDDMEAIYGGAFKRVRAELGASAFGLQVVDLPPNVEAYPEHDHSEDGQEEVYVTLSGSAVMTVEGESVAMDPATLVRVGPGTSRHVIPGDQGVRLLIIGGVPGAAYEPVEITKLGAPDPSLA